MGLKQRAKLLPPRPYNLAHLAIEDPVRRLEPAGGVTDRLWEVYDIVNVLVGWEQSQPD